MKHKPENSSTSSHRILKYFPPFRKQKTNKKNSIKPQQNKPDKSELKKNKPQQKSC